MQCIYKITFSSCDLWFTYNLCMWCKYDVILVLVLILYRNVVLFYLWCEQASKEIFNSTYNNNYYIILHCTALHCTALHCTALHCTALHCTALHCTALHCTALHCTALHCTALHCTARHGTARHGTARHGTARHGTALYCIEPRGCKCTFLESLNNSKFNIAKILFEPSLLRDFMSDGISNVSNILAYIVRLVYT